MPTIQLTSNAAKRILFLSEKEGKSGLSLRLAVDSGGCSGLQYKFNLENTITGEDTVFERDGARLVVDTTSLGFVDGAEVDYVSDLSGESFQIKNPLADSSCGCGSSFSMKL